MDAVGPTPAASTVSSGSSNGLAEPMDLSQESQPPHRRIPFARKRLPRDQALALGAVFEKKTHPTREEREALANELGM